MCKSISKLIFFSFSLDMKKARKKKVPLQNIGTPFLYLSVHQQLKQQIENNEFVVCLFEF